MGKTWNKFMLLMWKNFLLQWRHPIQTVIEILVPIIFTILLVLLRSLSNPVPHSARIFVPFSPTLFTDYSNGSTYKLLWSPKGNADLKNVMENTVNAINTASVTQLELAGYENKELLGEEVENTANFSYIFAGVEFDDSLGANKGLPENLDIKIRFPSESRLYHYRTWQTNMIYPSFQTHGPREPYSNTGSSPAYNAEGFLILQKEISLSVIQQLNKAFDRYKNNIVMERFHYPKWTSDNLLEVLQGFFGLIIMLSFNYTFITTVKAITNEKEKQLKEAMKIMGLPGWLHWTAWFLKTFILLLIAVVLMVVLLTIRWYPDKNFTIFTYSNPLVIVLLLLLFVCTTITYSFAISVFFSKANIAAAVAGVTWFMSYAPYIALQRQYDTLSLTEKLMTSLFSNTAIAYAFKIIFTFEGMEEGIQWNNIGTPTTSDDTLTIAHLMVMLIIDAVIYMLIALYVEAIFPGDYGVPKPFYFPFTKSYWCGNNLDFTIVEDQEQIENENYEKEPTHFQVGIQLQHLSKTFPHNRVAVDDVNLNMYQDQITVLLGHNGAGKTTTMSMLSGMIPPTGGTALINGRDIRKDMEKIRDSYGLCPQHNILFDDLTVREHIYFYSKLKGLNKNEINAEIEKYINLLEFVTKENSLSSSLSGGMKRKLSVAIALCGNSKVIMCDEPTAGIDPGTRRALWDLLMTQKKGRTILLTTHFMDEADLLGDRIAIMSEGKLQCVGSSFFLKKKYGAGYRLIMDVTKDCNVSGITNELQNFIPNIQMKSKIGSELTYTLPEQNISVFESMLRNLEEKSNNLGISSYGISLTTLEEVFMKVGDIQRHEDDNTSTSNVNEAVNGIANNNSDSEYDVHSSQIPLDVEFPLLQGWSLWTNQLLAMLMKKCLSYWRSWLLVIIQCAIPIVFIILTITLYRSFSPIKELPSLKIGLDSYSNPVTVLTSDVKTNIYSQSYIKLVEQQQHLLTNWNQQDMGKMILEKTENDTSTVRSRYIVGATFGDTITAWFNNNPLHSPPLTLQLVVNSILKAQDNLKSHFIQFYNHPLPFRAESELDNLINGGNIGFQLAFNLGFSMAFVSAFYSMFTIRERSSKAKHLQFVSGVKIIPFWGTAFIIDFISFFFVATFVTLTIAAFQEDTFKTTAELGRLFSIFMIFGFCMLPYTYLISYMFEVPSTGFTRTAIINIFTGPAPTIIVQILLQQELDLESIGKALDAILMIVPHYSFTAAVRDLSALGSLHSLCERLDTKNPLVCEQYPQCCSQLPDYFDFESPGIGRNVFVSLFMGFIFIAIQLLIEYGAFDKIRNKMCNRKSPIIQQLGGREDEDVLKEKQKIASFTSNDIKNYAVVLREVSKSYSNFLAVNKLSLSIEKYECFGLLGVNGAGKTTTFKLMTGDVKIFSGDAWINGLNLRSDRNRINQVIGYCPQFDALLDDLTCKETLIIFGLIHGLTYKQSSYEADRLAQDFDFKQHINKKVKELSGGNKRKLSTSIALIGNPSVLLLDEPTTGMDPATKRYLWNTLCKVRASGKCIVLTSHSMDECEALCTRLAIMVNGYFTCLGSTQHLKSKFSDGYLLTIKLKKTNTSNLELDSIEQFVNNKFLNVTVREKHQEMITFFIKDKSKPWSEMFGIMEAAKRDLNIEDYSLGQNSLEQIFISFTKQQRIVESETNK